MQHDKIFNSSFRAPMAAKRPALLELARQFFTQYLANTAPGDI
jgi:hypothetical protein